MSASHRDGFSIDEIELDAVNIDGIAFLDTLVFEHFYNAVFAQHALKIRERFAVVEIDVFAQAAEWLDVFFSSREPDNRKNATYWRWIGQVVDAVE